MSILNILINIFYIVRSFDQNFERLISASDFIKTLITIIKTINMNIRKEYLDTTFIGMKNNL